MVVGCFKVPSCTLRQVLMTTMKDDSNVNPLNAELNPICHLLALLGAHHIFHVSRIRVNEHMLNTGSQVLS